MKKMKDLIISLQSRDIIFELLASNADEQIAAHEVLHSIGLDHTFEKNSDDFIYKGQQTDNVMDYLNEGVALYQWQWKLINPAIKEILNRIINEQL